MRELLFGTDFIKQVHAYYAPASLTEQGTDRAAPEITHHHPVMRHHSLTGSHSFTESISKVQPEESILQVQKYPTLAAVDPVRVYVESGCS